MTRILITGMSAVGKSTVVIELAEGGFAAVVVDQPGWSEYAEPEAGGEGPEWLWREERMEDLLSTAEGEVLFVAGCARNQRKFYPRFTHVVLLTASESVTLHRLAARTNNSFGKTPQEAAKVLADKATFEERIRAGAGVVIDTDAPLEEVVEKLSSLARSGPRPGGS